MYGLKKRVIATVLLLGAATICIFQILKVHRAPTGPFVCVFTADLPYHQQSRGTANAMASLANEMSRHMPVRIVSAARSNLCRVSFRNAPYKLPYTCINTDGWREKSDAPDPFCPAELFSQWISSNPGMCLAAIVHEWAAPAAFVPHTMKLITVIHGATRWQGSWDDSTSMKRYADHILDAEERAQWHRSHAVVYPSYYMKQYTREAWGTPSSGTFSRVIPNFFPQQMAVKPYAVNQPTQIFVFIGVLGKRKGFDIFIELICAAHKNQKQTGPVRAHVYGSEDKEWAQMARKSCDAAFDFRGTRRTHDMFQEIRSAHGILLFASRHENLPMVLAEAATWKVPVISLDVGGSAEMFERNTASFQPTQDQMARKVEDVLLKRLLHPTKTSLSLLLRPSTSNQMLGIQWKTLIKEVQNIRQPTNPPKVAAQLVPTEKWDAPGVCSQEDGHILLFDKNFYHPGLAHSTFTVEGGRRMVFTIGVAAGSHSTPTHGYLPLGLMQWRWKSCNPVAPLSLERSLFCEWRHQNADAVSEPKDVLPLVLGWGMNNNVGFQKSSASVPLARPVSSERDCMWGHENLAYALSKTLNSTAPTLTSSCPRASLSWIAASDPPVFCKGNVINNGLVDSLGLSVFSSCGAHCILGSGHGNYAVQGFVFDGGKKCWAHSEDLRADPRCKSWMGSMIKFRMRVAPWMV